MVSLQFITLYINFSFVINRASYTLFRYRGCLSQGGVSSNYRFRDLGQRSIPLLPPPFDLCCRSATEIYLFRCVWKNSEIKLKVESYGPYAKRSSISLLLH